MSLKINIEKYRGSSSSSFTDRDWGENARKELELNEKELSEEVIEIVIPFGTTSFNPSFYLGLFYESFENLGALEFEKKYLFSFDGATDSRIIVLKKNLADGKRQAIDELSDDFEL